MWKIINWFKNLFKKKKKTQVVYEIPAKKKDNSPPWLNVAYQELGITEVPGRDTNSRIGEYFEHTTLGNQLDEIPWCAAFANFCLIVSGHSGTRSALARSFTDLSLWMAFEVKELVLGAIVVLSRGSNPVYGHVGFAVKWDENYVWLLGGNQSDKVCVQKFSRDRIVGVYLPKKG